MPYINNKQYAEYLEYRKKKDSGQNGVDEEFLRFVCSAHGYNDEEIGKYFLERIFIMNNYEKNDVRTAIVLDFKEYKELLDKKRITAEYDFLEQRCAYCNMMFADLEEEGYIIPLLNDYFDVYITHIVIADTAGLGVDSEDELTVYIFYVE